MVKGQVGVSRALSLQQLDALQAKATRTEDVLAVRHRLYSTHPDSPDKVEVYMQQLTLPGANFRSLHPQSEPLKRVKKSPTHKL